MTQLPVLPDLGVGLVLLPVALYGLSQQSVRFLSALVLGGVIGYLEIYTETSKRLPVALEGQDLSIQGVITDLPNTQDGIARVRIRIQESAEFKGNIYVSWYRPPARLAPGQVWQMTVRLNRPSGSVNFSLFDYEAWLFAKRIHARGYIRSTPAPELIGQVYPGSDGIRFLLREKIERHFKGSQSGFLYALALGDTSYITPEEWDVLGKTGTTHLLIISGLHTGLVAMFSFWILRRLPLHHHAVVLLSILATFCYALEAGWGLPAQRAFKL